MSEYIEDLLRSIDMYTYERCSSCGGGLADHFLSPGPVGNVQDWCVREEVPEVDYDEDADNEYIRKATELVEAFAKDAPADCKALAGAHSLERQGGEGVGSPMLRCLHRP